MEEKVGNAALPGDFQGHGPVDAAVGQIVDDVAEGGLVEGLPAVQTDTDHIFPAEVKMFRQFCGEGRISAAVAEDLPAVAVDRGLVGGGAEMEEYPPARPVGGDGQGMQIAAHHLIILLVQVIQRQLLHCVGNADGSQCFDLLFRPTRQLGRVAFREIPAIVEMQLHGRFLLWGFMVSS